jgi:hypothetical protein
MDWIETTEKLIQDPEYIQLFYESDDYFDAFERWASGEYPELYGND